jgi:hypothetical protein
VNVYEYVCDRHGPQWANVKVGTLEPAVPAGVRRRWQRVDWGAPRLGAGVRTTRRSRVGTAGVGLCGQAGFHGLEDFSSRSLRGGVGIGAHRAGVRARGYVAPFHGFTRFFGANPGRCPELVCHALSGLGIGCCNLEEFFQIMVGKVGRRRPGEPPLARAGARCAAETGARTFLSVVASTGWKTRAPLPFARRDRWSPPSRRGCSTFGVHVHSEAAGMGRGTRTRTYKSACWSPPSRRGALR